MNWELCFYYGGTAVLTDSAGRVVWSSADDEVFEEEFDELVTIDDAEEILDYLFESDYLPDDVEPEVIESSDTGEDETDEDENEDEDEDEDEDFDEDDE